MYICSNYDGDKLWHRFTSYKDNWKYEVYDPKQDRLVQEPRFVTTHEMEAIIENEIFDNERSFHVELYGDGE